MTNLTKGIAVAAMALSLPLMAGSSATAAPLMAGSALSTASAATVSSDLTQVRWRGHGYRGGGRYYRRGGGWGWGGVGAGLAAGALIGGAIAASQAPVYAAPAPVYGGDDAVAYCMQRYKSYDPRSGTYLNYDGNRYPCQ